MVKTILDISFNQYTTHFTVSTQSGYIIYDATNDLIQKIYHQLNRGIGMAKLLGSSNLVGYVGGGTKPFGSPNTFIMHDEKTQSNPLEIDYDQPICNVLLGGGTDVNKNKIEYIILVLRGYINILNPKIVQIGNKLTYANERGLCVLCRDESVPTIATLGQKKGEIQIWWLHNDNIKKIYAHNSNIAAIALNNDGTLVATASERGTVIKIFDTTTGKMKKEVRRGTMSTDIYSLAFSQKSNYIACCSGSGTLHIFNIESEEGNMKSTFSSMADYLPEYFSSEWSLKKIDLGSTSKAVCAFDERDRLHVATYNANYIRIEGRNFDQITRKDINLALEKK